MKFNTFIHDVRILKALDALGFHDLTSVQQNTIPVLLDNKDCIVQSKTGSGKTAAYALPILEKIIIDQKEPQALILAPTRELVLQIQETFDHLGVYKKIKTVAVFGKQPFAFQKEDLSQRCHVIIATPGRLLEHLKEHTFDSTKIQYLILDEADEMLGLNFYQDILQIIEYLSDSRINCLLSATINDSIESLSKDILNDPVWIINNDQADQIDQSFYYTKMEEKVSYLPHLLVKEKPESCIVFANTRQMVDEIYEQLQSRQISVNKIHGGMLQEDRLRQMNAFKQGEFRILVSTDVAARGIDIQKVDLIINYEVPNTFWIYIHRIGRSGRMKNKGKAITLVSDQEKEKYLEIINKLNLPEDLKTIEPQSEYDLSCLSKPERQLEDKTKKLRKDITKLYINAGKSKKIRAKDLVGAIMSIDEIEFDDIGIIQIQEHQSYVDILNGKGKIVLEVLQNKKIKNKSVRVEVANH